MKLSVCLSVSLSPASTLGLHSTEGTTVASCSHLLIGAWLIVSIGYISEGSLNETINAFESAGLMDNNVRVNRQFFSRLRNNWSECADDIVRHTVSYPCNIRIGQPLTLLLAVFVYDPLTWIVSLFLAADYARMAVGLFITLARQSGTRCHELRISDSFDGFKRFLKTNLFSTVTTVSMQRIRGFLTRRATFYLLTYLMTV